MATEVKSWHTGLALYTFYPAITDRAEPVEALFRANTRFSFGLYAGLRVILTSQVLALVQSWKSLAEFKLYRGVLRTLLFSAIAQRSH